MLYIFICTLVNGNPTTAIWMLINVGENIGEDIGSTIEVVVGEDNNGFEPIDPAGNESVAGD